MRERAYYVYVLASRIGGTLYIGVTNDLVRRVKIGLIEEKNPNWDDLYPSIAIP